MTADQMRRLMELEQELRQIRAERDRLYADWMSSELFRETNVQPRPLQRKTDQVRRNIDE